MFHVAGTNGKGSTVATLAALLASRGLRVGRYTSPHLVDFRERIVVGARPVSEDEVVAFVREHAASAERLGATFFEFTTAMAFDHFARAGAEVVVAETGLGGRLDSTNVVQPVVAAVTEIGLDHTEILGDTIEAIAHEKAGVFKRGAPAVIGARHREARAILAAHARDAGADAIRVVADEVTVSDVRVDVGGTSFEVDAPFGRGRLATPLVGRFQADNTVTALTALDAAGPAWRVAFDDLPAALGAVRLPGRFQRVGRWLFDVAHNADGARVLAETLRATPIARPVTALVAVLADKDWRGILEALAPVADRVILTVAPTAPPARVWNPHEALAHARARGWEAEAVDDFDAALARAAVGDGTTLVAGSFHTVGDAMARLQVDPLAG